MKLTNNIKIKARNPLIIYVEANKLDWDLATETEKKDFVKEKLKDYILKNTDNFINELTKETNIIYQVIN